MEDFSHVKTVPNFLNEMNFNHREGILSKEPSRLMRAAISLMSPRVIVEDYIVERIKDLAQRGPVVYALKYRSLYDLEYLRLRLALLELPAPCYVFGLRKPVRQTLTNSAQWYRKLVGRDGHSQGPQEQQTDIVRRILQRGGATTFFLVDEKTSRARYVHPEDDPISVLMDIQASFPGSISLIPMAILYDRTQRRTIRPFWESFMGDPDRPGIMKRLLIAIRKWTVPELLIGEPIHLISEFEEFGASHELDDVPFDIRTKLVNALNERIRVNRGPERMSRTEIKERVLQDQKVQRAVRDAVSRNAGSESDIRNKAESFVEEIAGDQRIQLHHFLYYVLKWLFSKMFDDVDVVESQFDTLKRENEKGSLIYVSCHKSHLDYLVIGYLSFINQMAIPYMAAGKNLSFWPVGPILRNAGAFFIRRSFKNLGTLTRLYTTVFEAYLKVLVREKVNINFYIEGGRSRTGKLLPPRLGMLAFLLQAVDEGHVDDLSFVPTYVTYDQVPEESSYLKELAGREKQKESFWSFLRSRELLKKRFGKAYIRFHAPISYKNFCEACLPGDHDGKPDMVMARKIIQDFAYYVMNGMVEAGVVAPTDLTAAALLSPGTTSVSQTEVLSHARILHSALISQNTELASSLSDLEDAVRTSIGIFRLRGFIETAPDAAEDHSPLYLIRPSKRINLDFYRNALINFLWAPSLLAMALLSEDGNNGVARKGSISDQFVFLRDLMYRELIFNPLVSDASLTAGVVDFFRDMQWIDEQLNIVSTQSMRTLAAVTRDLLRVYYLALVASHELGSQGLTQKEFARLMAELGEQKALKIKNAAPPPVTMVNVENALSRFSEMGIFQYRPGKKLLAAVADPRNRDETQERLARVVL
jgi:glycerol-3-phosphate O-acyltransferase